MAKAVVNKTLASLSTDMDQVIGWFHPSDAVMMTGYNTLLVQEGLAANTLEIGVYHGKSALLVAGFRAPGAKFYAVDVFEGAQSFGSPGEGTDMKASFLTTMAKGFGSTDFMEVKVGSSADLEKEDLPGDFSFCHIDGNHTAEAVYHDLTLCWQILKPGGLVCLDDYFNRQYPGISKRLYDLCWSILKP